MNVTVTIHQAIESFITQRLQEKLDPIEKKLAKAQDEDQRQSLNEQAAALREKYTPAVWIADAARRVSQIQLVTHALKYSHPDAGGTSLYSRGNPAANASLIGTHSLPETPTPDVVGNAAALDVFKFLSLEVDGKALWQLAREADPELLAALPGSEEENRQWMNAFAGLADVKDAASSHKLAKQLYWPLETGSYHLLQPLFSSSLVHEIWLRLREDRFGDAAKAAREARRKEKPHHEGYREWPNLVIQGFGGTKPQNISQLNSERRGEAWLLPSLPPQWQSRSVALPLHAANAFERFERRSDVRELLRRLRRFLRFVNAKDWNNIDIRNRRAWYVDELIDRLILWATALQQEEPGWSARGECRLPTAQQYWLDPWRDDPDFAEGRAGADWPREVAADFGRWLNRQLRKDKLPVGDAELKAWRSEAEPRLRELLEEMHP